MGDRSRASRGHRNAGYRELAAAADATMTAAAAGGVVVPLHGAHTTANTSAIFKLN